MFSIKKFLFLSLTAAAVLAGCGPRIPDRITPYSCEYTLFVNGTEAGSAVNSLETTDSMFINTERLEMGSGDRKYITEYQIRETLDFKPVFMKSENFMEISGEKQKFSTSAEFKGRNAVLNADGKIKKIQLSTDFFISGNYFMQELIRQGFKKGSHVEGRIYEPSMSQDETVRFSVAVLGTKTVMINGMPENLIHLKEIIEDFKDIDLYLGDNGIVRKMKVLMLNNRIEMVIKE